MSKLGEALRQRFSTPQACLRALGLPPDILDGPRLASDEEEVNLKPLLIALKADTRGTTVAADESGDSYAERWPHASRITVGY